MPFVTPRLDRTQEDVLYAFANQTSTSDLKGALNVSDVNRMIGNTIHLRDLLNQYGFTSSFPNQPLFTMDTLPHVNSQIDVIRNNIRTIVQAFYTMGNPEIASGNTLNYIDVNALEMNIKITNDLITALILEMRNCGYYTCGQDITL